MDQRRKNFFARKSSLYVLSLDLNTDSESALIIVSGNKFQTANAEQQKTRLVSPDERLVK